MNLKNKVLKILVIDDDEDDVMLVKEILCDGFGEQELQIDSVDNLDDFRARLKEGGHHICLLDYRIGPVTGFELMDCVNELSPDMPAIMLTGQGDSKTAVEAMKRGAVDFVEKGRMEGQVLVQAIRRALRLHEQALQRQKAEKELSAQSERLKGLSEAVLSLLTRSDIESGVTAALKTMGQAMGVRRFDVLTCSTNQPDMSDDFKLEYEWKGEGEDGEYLFTGIGSLSKLGSLLGPRYLEQLVRGEILNNSDGSCLEETPFSRENFSASLRIFPLKVNAGFIGILMVFGDLPGEGEGSMVSILQTFSASLAWKIKRSMEEQTFHSLVQNTSSQTGENFFQTLTRQLSLTIPARCAFVYEIVQYGRTLVRIQAGWDGEPVSEKELFDLVGTAGEDSLAGMYSYCPEAARDKFPKDEQLARLKVNSFASVPFFDNNSQMIGQIAIMDDRPMVERERTLSILRLFASRASAELVRMRAEEQMRSMAYHDALTGLPNRVLLNDRLELALHQAHRNKNMIAVLYLDFDNFKRINDNYGHPVGDQLLKEGSRRLKDCLREGDTVARLGGDEFVLLLPDIKSTSDVARLALKVNGAFKPPFYLDDHEIMTTVSIGISMFPQDGTESKVLLKKADDSLFEAKRKGRDSFQFASPVV